MNAGQRVAKWIKDNPGTGLVVISGSADFPGDKYYKRYALIDRWGGIVGYVQKKVDKEELEDV